MALTVTRSLVRPLRRVVTAVRDVAAGTPVSVLPPDRPDEFGDITVALRQFQDQAEKLRAMAYRDPLTGRPTTRRRRAAQISAVSDARLQPPVPRPRGAASTVKHGCDDHDVAMDTVEDRVGREREHPAAPNIAMDLRERIGRD